MAVETKIATMILGTNPQLKYHRNTNVATKNGTKARADDHMTRWSTYFCRTSVPPGRFLFLKKMFQGDPRGEMLVLVGSSKISAENTEEKEFFGDSFG